ncbi:MAG: DUF892 family protein [Prosthecobacter sp.]|jgi:ferritin-like metal-binding protein YciE|uniref:DUF892 family protein n=1 Tax=Prosthecobacter sp. TaxID=1965333 RepID=UPI0019F827D8|nr:DUF892 family protein [Prosthecobacter sp.]MBE2283871.1 DUF892 family protein [Prosthecobacter sp.]
MKSIHPLHQLLQHQLRSLFDAETQFNVLLPRMIEKTTDDSLRHGLVEIRGDTMENIDHIQTICHLLDTSPTGVVCKTMQDLIREASAATQAAKEGVVTDQQLMANARQIVHYEIASFDLACTFANSAGQEDACVLLAMLANRADYHNRLLEKLGSGTATAASSDSVKPRRPKGANTRKRVPAR